MEKLGYELNPKGHEIYGKGDCWYSKKPAVNTAFRTIPKEKFIYSFSFSPRPKLRP